MIYGLNLITKRNSETSLMWLMVTNRFIFAATASSLACLLLFFLTTFGYGANKTPTWKKKTAAGVFLNVYMIVNYISIIMFHCS